MSTKNLPSRSTRGKRMTTLVGDEALVDEEFWKMDLFKDEEGDDEYKSEEEEEDVVDADFDNPEDKEEEGEAEVEKEKPDKRKRGVYVDPKAKKPNKRAKLNTETHKKKPKPEPEPDAEASEPESDAEPDAEPKSDRIDLTHGTPPSNPSSPPTTPATIRKSTRAVALQRAVVREKERVETEKKRSLRPKKKSPIVVRRITQEELLEEAKLTEQINTESLKYILSLEEEKKKVKDAPTILGPVVTYYSKNGKTCMCFDELPTVLTQNEPAQAPTPPARETCPITGLPAKYRDPKTGVCYANMQAFKILRERYLHREEAKCNSRLVHLNSMLQETKRKKDELQKMPLASGGFVTVV